MRKWTLCNGAVFSMTAAHRLDIGECELWIHDESAVHSGENVFCKHKKEHWGD